MTRIRIWWQSVALCFVNVDVSEQSTSFPIDKLIESEKRKCSKKRSSSMVVHTAKTSSIGIEWKHPADYRTLAQLRDDKDSRLVWRSWDLPSFQRDLACPRNALLAIVSISRCLPAHVTTRCGLWNRLCYQLMLLCSIDLVYYSLVTFAFYQFIGNSSDSLLSHESTLSPRSRSSVYRLFNKRSVRCSVSLGYSDRWHLSPSRYANILLCLASECWLMQLRLTVSSSTDDESHVLLS